jgi:hypothetical protein
LTTQLVGDALTALTRFRVELGHLEGPLQLCERCSQSGLATYWTREFVGLAVPGADAYVDTGTPDLFL